jgi:hypothetical protein
MSCFRAYFFDLTTRKELVDHPANAKTWLGTSGMYHDGKAFVKDTALSVTVADYASMHSIKGRREVTRADFAGPVAVKIWFGPNNVEWRKLVDDHGNP